MISEDQYNVYFESLKSGDRLHCEQIVSDLMASGVELRMLYTDLFQKSLYTIGKLWECNQLSIATEHLATAITERLMAVTYPTLFRRDHIDKAVTIACVANEYHQVGAKMVCDFFELNGWHGYFLGASTPVEGLLHFLDQRPVNLLGLSLSMAFNLTHLEQTVAEVRGAFPELPILVGGQAFSRDVGNFFERFGHVQYLSSLTAVEAYLEDQGADVGRTRDA